jgi:G:T-mismatch repair DNA endonuclease (very short patch repair protein)
MTNYDFYIDKYKTNVKCGRQNVVGDKFVQCSNLGTYSIVVHECKYKMFNE